MGRHSNDGSITMYAIRCTVTNSESVQALTGMTKSNYIVLVDTPKVTQAFKMARQAMHDKFRGQYNSRQFEFATGAQTVDGVLSADQPVKILFTNL
jgi:hypothetical protein